jgi:hypothetical protein
MAKERASRRRRFLDGYRLEDDLLVAGDIGLEFAFGGGFAFDLGQPGDPVALQTPVKRRARQVRDGRLQGVKAVVERQQRMPSESNDDSLFLD